MFNDQLEKSILKTILFFDIFEYPLTLIEVYKWLYQFDQTGINLSILSDFLTNLQATGKIENSQGFYFIAGQIKHVETRLKRYRITEAKFRIAVKAAWYLKFLPFIKLIAVCNNVGYNNCRLNSDIDFFIITAANRLWLTRLLVTTSLSILRLRRHGRFDVNRICLSFYLADSKLDLSKIAITPQDPYLVYWLATLAPIYQPQNSYNKFIQANSWAFVNLKNWSVVSLSIRRSITDSRVSLFIKDILEKTLSKLFGQSSENFVKKIQWSKVQNYFGDLLKENNSNIVISNQMLKFHKTDRRLEYYQAWQKKLNFYQI